MKAMKLVCLAALAALFVVQPSVAEDARVRIVSKTVDVGSLVDGAGETVTVSLPGVVLGDACVASFGVDLQDLTVSCYVQAANAIEVRVQNESTATVNLASTTMRVFVFWRGTR